MANPGWPWPLFQVEPALTTFNVDSERRDEEIPRQACDFQHDVPTNLLSARTPKRKPPRERIPRETLIFFALRMRVVSSLRRWLVSIPEPELSFSITATRNLPLPRLSLFAHSQPPDSPRSAQSVLSSVPSAPARFPEGLRAVDNVTGEWVRFSNQPWFAIAAALSEDLGRRANRRHPGTCPSPPHEPTQSPAANERFAWEAPGDLKWFPTADERRNRFTSTEVLAAAGWLSHGVAWCRTPPFSQPRKIE